MRVSRGTATAQMSDSIGRNSAKAGGKSTGVGVIHTEPGGNGHVAGEKSTVAVGNSTRPAGNLPKSAGNLPKPAGNLPKPAGNLPKTAGNLPKSGSGFLQFAVEM